MLYKNNASTWESQHSPAEENLIRFPRKPSAPKYLPKLHSLLRRYLSFRMEWAGTAALRCGIDIVLDCSITSS